MKTLERITIYLLMASPLLMAAAQLASALAEGWL